MEFIKKNVSIIAFFTLIVTFWGVNPCYGAYHYDPYGEAKEKVMIAGMVITSAALQGYIIYRLVKRLQAMRKKDEKKPEAEANKPEGEAQSTSEGQTDGKPKKKKKKGKKGQKADAKPSSSDKEGTEAQPSTPAQAEVIKEEEVKIEPPSANLTLIEFKVKYQTVFNTLVTAYRKCKNNGKTPETIAEYEATKKYVFDRNKAIHEEDKKRIVEIVESL